MSGTGGNNQLLSSANGAENASVHTAAGWKYSLQKRPAKGAERGWHVAAQAKRSMVCGSQRPSSRANMGEQPASPYIWGSSRAGGTQRRVTENLRARSGPGGPNRLEPKIAVELRLPSVLHAGKLWAEGEELAGEREGVREGGGGRRVKERPFSSARPLRRVASHRPAACTAAPGISE